MVGFGNILKPSEVVLSGYGGGNVTSYFKTSATPNQSSVRVSKPFTFTGTGTYHLTDDESPTGVAFFNNIWQVIPSFVSDPGIDVSVIALIVSNTEISLFSYHGGNPYNQPIDVNLFAI